MLKITDLNKYYNKNSHNKLHVLKDINIDLPDTGLISIVGESGSGKTTLLHAIGGLDKYEGEISYNGKTYRGEKLDLYRQENIGVIFQNYLLFEDLTIYENLALALRIIGIKDEEEVNKRIEYVLKQVGMFKQRKKLAKNLSGGQQQRVAIARALIKNTKILLADEPTGNLDRKNTIEIMNILKAISKTTLVLLVTHNKEMAHIYSDKLLLIADGKLEDKEFAAITTLTNTTDDTIYLEDYQKEEAKAQGLDVELYGEAKDLAIKLIIKENHIYLVSNQNITLINQRNVKEKREEITAIEMSQTNYDASFYDDTKRTRRTLSTWKEIVKSFFKRTRKRDRFLKFSFFALGCILAFSCAFFFNSLFFNNPGSFVLDNKYGIYPKNLESYTARFDNYEEIAPFIDKLANYDYVSISRADLVSNEYANTLANPQLMYLGNISDTDMVAGQKKGCVITTSLAEILFDTKDYQSLIGMKISVGSNYTNDKIYTINGIVKNGGTGFYLDSKTLGDYIDHMASTKFTGSPFNTLLYQDYANQLELVESTSYTDVSTYQVYALEGSSYSLNQIIGNSKLEVVGFVRLNEAIKPFTIDSQSAKDSMLFFLSQAEIELYKSEIININYQIYQDIDYEIVTGTAPLNYGEVMLPINSIYDNYRIGDNFDGFKVVGFYLADYAQAFDDVLVNETTFILRNYAYTATQLWFEPTDLAALETFIANNYPSYQVMLVKDYYAEMARIDNAEQMLIFGLLALVLLVIYVLFIFFVMRTKVIKDSFDIAVFRSLGATKKAFYIKFIKENLIMTLFTSTIGYIICFIFYIIFNKLSAEITSLTNFFRVDAVSFFAGLAIIYAVNILMSILPTYLYLRKSPADLVSKYDM